MKETYIYRLPYKIIILLWVFLAACSTQKNTFMNRNYHSITTKFNGYFNANESYREGVARLQNLHEDDYENVLSIFKYGSEHNAGSITANMDIAYQKSSTAIRRHSMNIRGVEYNRWIDDCFYLIARSHFFKRDYNLSVLTFEYIIRQYDTPLKYKSMVWVAKAYTHAGQYERAAQALDRVKRYKDEGLLDSEVQLLYSMAHADYHLRLENYKQASVFLEQATKLSNRRRQKARLTFILAQSYHRDRDFANAQQNYARVLKLNPDFEMAFQSRINMAMAFDIKSGDSGFILSELKGMLRDSKNREFRDQIYYALAQFNMRQQKEEQAITYYKKSIDNYRGNDSQKGLAFLRLGEIYLERKDFLSANNYYDSTMVSLSREHEDYQLVAEKSMLLRQLATHIRVAQREDSLQRLASLNTTERNQILDGILAEIEEQARVERELEQERARMRQDMARRGTRQAGPGEAEGGWYFYNPTAMSSGQNDFYAKWGERKLEDLWRISNKRVIAFGEMGEMGLEDQEGEGQGGRVTRASLMENVPTTPEKLEASNARLANAYYNKGLIFKNNLEVFPNAIKSFETLVNRFPDNENTLYGAYFLYSLLQQTGNQSQAQVYKNLIINNYPDTDFAKILSDPDYAENVRSRQNQSKNLYKQAFEAYSNGDYARAIELCEDSQELDISIEQAAQFSFLKALAVGKRASRAEFKRQLTYITEQYQQTKVHEPATNLLAYLGGAGGGLLSGMDEVDYDMEAGSATQPERQEIDESVFSFNMDAVHFYVLIADTRNIQVRQLRNQINVYNQQAHEGKELNMSTLFFEDNKQLITITNFPNANGALVYGDGLLSSDNIVEYGGENLKGFAISVENYPLFYQERKLDEYLLFYTDAYAY